MKAKWDVDVQRGDILIGKLGGIEPGEWLVGIGAAGYSQLVIHGVLGRHYNGKP